jgi:3D (Asp-Asp-Asp) domain-containing protein
MFYANPTVAEPLALSQEPRIQQTSELSGITVSTDATNVASDVDVMFETDNTIHVRPRTVHGAANTTANGTVNGSRTEAFQQSPASRKSDVADASNVPARPFTATAYSLRGRTASGKTVARGLIAADRRVLPLGTRVRLDAGRYSGEYLVADTGGAVRGRKIDIWVPHTSEAMRFGRQTVKLTVLTKSRKPTAPTTRAKKRD